MAKRRTGAATRTRKAASGGRSRSSARTRARGGARKAGRTKKAAARRAGARKGAARKGARKAAARKPGARKATARKAPAGKARGRKTTARKASPRKASAARRTGARKAPRAPEAARKVPALNRPRRIVEDEDIVPGPPSSLDLDRSASSVRSGRREMRERSANLTQTSAALTGGDVDADWESAYSVGDEAPGGDNPTPDQDVVDDIGRAVGVEYADNEELKGEEKIAKRDRNRWELDPASAEDYNDRD